MQRASAWAVLPLAAGLSTLICSATEPLTHSLIHGTFKPSIEESKGGPIHPLAPTHKVASIQDKNSFQIVGAAGGEAMAFPVRRAPGSSEPMALAELREDGATFFAPVDLTGSGVSDLIYTRADLPGWRILSNGTRLAAPSQAFLAGLYPAGSDAPRTDLIPADNREFKVDPDLLAAVGDFLGNGTEQLAYTRPGWEQIWIVGAHGVTQMAADLRGIEGNGSGARRHWLFPFKSKGAQHTRIGYYRVGSAELETFFPRGLAFKRDKAPLKGNWEKLNQNVLDWPRQAPGLMEQKTGEAKDAVASVMGMDMGKDTMDSGR